MAPPGSDEGAHAAEAAERRWSWVVFGISAFMLAMMVAASVHWNAMPPSRLETVDAATLHQTGEFVENNLGSAVQVDGSVVVRVVAQQYSFSPQCLLVPAETPVTFRVTSADVVHGFLVERTNVNAMVIPGYVTTVRTVFKEPGEHLMPCHEFCGVGHAAMWARVKVVPRSAFPIDANGTGRYSCAQQ